MKKIASLLMVMSLLSGTVGCVSSYKHVMVSVVDSTTGAPIQGASVKTSYFRHSAFSLASTRISQATTDEKGEAILSANYLPREPMLFWRSPNLTFAPSYWLTITNDTYHEQSGTYDNSLAKALLARQADFIPAAPDIVLKVTSEAVYARLRIETQNEIKVEEKKAEELFRNSPDFWPGHKDSPYAWVEDGVGRRLIFKRWEAASKVSLGSTEEIASIRAVVLKHMAHPKAEVLEIRWLSASVVMVSSSWYSGPLASAGYTYVLQKGNDGWIVLAHYLESIS